VGSMPRLRSDAEIFPPDSETDSAPGAFEATILRSLAMNLNQVTLPARDLPAAIGFYRQLGFRLIVDADAGSSLRCSGATASAPRAAHGRVRAAYHRGRYSSFCGVHGARMGRSRSGARAAAEPSAQGRQAPWRRLAARSSLTTDPQPSQHPVSRYSRTHR